MTTFSAAAGQLTARDDVDENLRQCAQLAERAADRGASLLVLPENFAFLGRHEADKFNIAEIIGADQPGRIVSALMELGQKHQLWVVGGGMPEIMPEEAGKAITRTYNTAVVVSPDGELAASYRKIHLFDVDIPGGAQLRESDATAGGDELVVVDTPLAKLGLSICYDVRFPELYRELTRQGAEVLVVPAAFTAHTGKAHWHTLLRARAVENQCYVIAAGQVGRHNDKRESFGHSLIIDPWGTLLDEVNEGDGLAFAEIDLALLEQTRQRMPCLAHRRL